jgi:hypothetical protein
MICPVQRLRCRPSERWSQRLAFFNLYLHSQSPHQFMNYGTNLSWNLKKAKENKNNLCFRTNQAFNDAFSPPLVLYGPPLISIKRRTYITRETKHLLGGRWLALTADVQVSNSKADKYPTLPPRSTPEQQNLSRFCLS